jgi:hypothetical protein
LFSILKEDPYIAESTRKIGGPGLQNHSTPPGFKLFMIYPIAYSEIGPFRLVRALLLFSSFDRKVIQTSLSFKNKSKIL